MNMAPRRTPSASEQTALAHDIRRWAAELGFARVGIADIDLSAAEPGLLKWLAQGFHGEMDYMARHALLRARPELLVPGTVSVLAVAMDYLPADNADWIGAEWKALEDPGRAHISLYARGRDYHKVLRARLKRLAERVGDAVGPFGYRVFTDSAPVLEVELATKAGLGWRGKHTLLLAREAGSMFFLGEIFLDFPLPPDRPRTEHCGQCTRCLEVCPTQAIVAPYRLDARRCISYLTIELRGSIPEDLRPLIGNRIYGCDDCQLVCPWNKYAQATRVDAFRSRGLEQEDLAVVFAWDEARFLEATQASPIRRIGHERWLRNVAVALGNALARPLSAARRANFLSALSARRSDPSALVREHVQWALAQRPPAC
jgi:epoxyqueuosine reductase